ncbi:TPA: UDP-N-acetylglucosamine 2-epimerase (non-hydrolyzing) [Candidatus Poribacteria bacterium]|nr:UDP-N-acetylglucosamine 2-epimerase (non-hydrolyzing) [Candidatus Poribacteria bacterium]
MKIVYIVGARPQLVKHALLSKELGKYHKNILIHTGQHYDYNMNKVFFEELGLSDPDYNLGVGSGTHGYQTGEMLKRIEDILIIEKPDMVIIYGDTNSTLAGALCAAKLHIILGHVEAGVRNYDKTIPEEINRITADHCSDYLFCPTNTAVKNLRKEGIKKGVYLTGDVMVDTLKLFKKYADQTKIIEDLRLNHKDYILLTIHRAGNTDNVENLVRIAQAIEFIHKAGETIVFPAHPRTLKALKNQGLSETISKSTVLLEPQGYFEFINLLNNAKKVITDSGGVQKEAYILKVPCITLLDNTSWIETVDDGWNILAGTDVKKIVEAALNFRNHNTYSNIFGEGACKRIANVLRSI